MKKYMIAVLAAACLTMAGCSQKSSVERTSREFNSLPSAVQKAVRSHAPNAEIASVDRKTRDGLNYYVIEFKEPGTNPKLTVAENGTLMSSENEKAMGGSGPQSGTSSGTSSKGTETGAPKGTTGRAATIDLSALPAAVQKTLKSQAPNATITGIKRHEDNGRMIYEFEFEDAGKNPSMQISEDGTVVQSLKK